MRSGHLGLATLQGMNARVHVPKMETHLDCIAITLTKILREARRALFPLDRQNTISTRVADAHIPNARASNANSADL